MQEKNAFVAAYARAVVAELAPKELPLFRALSGAYFADPEAVYRRHGPGTLAFGDTGAAVAVTPFVLAVISAVTTYLIHELARHGASQPDPARLFAPPGKARGYRGALLAGLIQGFSLDELRALCFELGIDRDVIGDLAKEPFARTLIEYCERHALLETLVSSCEQRRPEIVFRTAASPGELPPQHPPPAARVSWTSEQLKQVRSIVIDTAKRLEVPDPTGPDLANQLVLGLVMA
jgi:hypothetical protein